MSPFFCTKDESLDWTEITKSGTRLLCLALNEHHLLTCYIILVNLMIFLICKLTFQWLLIDYKYDFYVLLPSWTWNLENFAKCIVFLTFLVTLLQTFCFKKIKTSDEGIVTKKIEVNKLLLILEKLSLFPSNFLMFNKDISIRLKQMVEIMHQSR